MKDSEVLIMSERTLGCAASEYLQFKLKWQDGRVGRHLVLSSHTVT